jgi:hypothetical protein
MCESNRVGKLREREREKKLADPRHSSSSGVSAYW